MMAAAEILSALTAHDARVVVDGDRMRVLFPFRSSAAIRIDSRRQG